MICFELYMNGCKMATTGISKFGVLHANLCLVTANPAKKRDQELDFSLGGLEENEYLKWYGKDDLKAGDEITVRIIESQSFDVPIEKRWSDPELERKEKKKYFEQLKKEIEEEERST
jgi:hypothetical protein